MWDHLYYPVRLIDLSCLMCLLPPSVRSLLWSSQIVLRYSYCYSGELALSEQAVQLILMGVFALLNYLPDLSYVFKATPLAMACLISSIIVVIISIFLNIENIDGDFLAIKPLSVMEIFTVASVNGFAFIVHTAVSPVVKQN